MTNQNENTNVNALEQAAALTPPESGGADGRGNGADCGRDNGNDWSKRTSDDLTDSELENIAGGQSGTTAPTRVSRY